MHDSLTANEPGFAPQRSVPCVVNALRALGALRFSVERAGPSFRLRQVGGGETLTFPRKGAAPKIKSEY